MTNGGVHSPLVKYVIFEKFRSDPEKDGSEVTLAVDTSILRDPVFGRLFWTFLHFLSKIVLHFQGRSLEFCDVR